MLTRSPYLFPVAAMLALLGACSDSSPVDTVSPVARIEVTAPSSVLAVGGILAVRATVIAANGSLVVDRRVEWVSSNTNIATVTSTGNPGNLTATVTGVGVGTVFIVANLDGKTGSVSLAVPPPAVPPPPAPPAPVPQRAFLWSEEGGFVAIPALPGTTSTIASGINNAGTVVGHGFGMGQTRPFIWTRARGTSIELGLLPGFQFCLARAVNDADVVVGSCYGQSAGQSRAFRWTAGSGMAELPLPPGAVGSGANSINSSGEVAGVIFVASGSAVTHKPGRWSNAGVFEALKLSGLGTFGEATAIDDAGTAVGWSSDGDYYSPIAAVLWKRGTTTETVIEACTQSGCATFPRAMSRNGRVTGYRNSRPFSWTEAGGFIDYPRTDGARFGEGTGINDLGQVIVNEYSNNASQATLISPAGVRRSLGLLPGTTSISASAINNLGQVAGYGR